jgi:hypothetical protein
MTINYLIETCHAARQRFDSANNAAAAAGAGFGHSLTLAQEEWRIRRGSGCSLERRGCGEL